MNSKKSHQHQTGRAATVRLIDDVIIIIFAITSMILLALELNGAASAAEVRAIQAFDLAVSVVFLTEFIARLYRVPDKKHFLFFHWWELFAAVPITSVTTQALRGLKVLRLFEVVRVIRASARLEVTGEVLGPHTHHPYIIEAISTALALLFTGSVAFFVLESGYNPAVHSLWDAFWWAAATMTTTGYGDIYPVTNSGRILAIVLMVSGVVGIAWFTGIMVQYLSLRKNRKH